MDLHQIENIITISEASSIREAAQKLFLTQSALNQQLLHLEKELGVQLFRRNRNHLEITPAGQLYIDGARQILQIRKNTYQRISDFADEKHDTIRIGFTPDRGMTIFSRIYPDFFQKYPHVRMIPQELIAREQEKLISDGKLDLGFLTLTPDQQTINQYFRIASEELLLVVPDSHPLAANGTHFHGNFSGPLPTASLSDFRDCPFVLTSRQTTMRSLTDSCFEACGFTPDVLLESRSSNTLRQLAASLKCCTILPSSYAFPTRHLVYFALDSHPSWDFVVSYQQKTSLNQVQLDFIHMVAELWNNMPYVYQIAALNEQP